MSGSAPSPIKADSLRRRDEWQAAFPTAAVVWEETADEGQGTGFDGLDPSAMVRALFSTRASWSEVLDWYRSVLEAGGWQGREVKPWTWWEWTSADRLGERIDLLDRGIWTERPGWPLPEGRAGELGFEVIFKARGPFSVSQGPILA